MSSASGIDPALRAELEAVYAFYSALARDLNPETGVGGRLLYIGELDMEGARLVRAANIAGAASLSATSDSDRQRSAIREGTIDFLVTSLDEALRILKNEIRKKNPVAVGIGAAPARVVAEMRERGVLPDLLRDGCAAELADFVSQGAQPIGAATPASQPRLVVLPSAPHDFEKRVLALIPESEFAARRWVRLAPRYLGPAARRVRSVPSSPAVAAELSIRQD
jgi:urocanate hydratase